VEHYDGEVGSIWKQGNPDGAEVLERLAALPGFREWLTGPWSGRAGPPK